MPQPRKDCSFRAIVEEAGAPFPFTPERNNTSEAVASVSPVRAIRTENNNSYVWALTQRELEISGDGGKTWIARTLPVEHRGGLHFYAAGETTVVLASDRGVFHFKRCRRAPGARPIYPNSPWRIWHR